MLRTAGISGYLGYIAKQTRQVTRPTSELSHVRWKVDGRVFHLRCHLSHVQKEVGHAQYEWDYRP
jgi:hypothetical protein